jgi:beta-phosphoglucomutase-like phosphatase (HAD superfamily)
VQPGGPQQKGPPKVRPTEAGMPDLADRLNELFRTVHRADSTELWNNETAAAEISRTGPAVSAAYLSQLRTGKRLNPSARHLAALAGIFQVDLDSFFPPCVVGHPARTGGPSPVAARLTTMLDGVSPAGVATIERAIAGIRAAESLPACSLSVRPDRPGEDTEPV